MGVCFIPLCPSSVLYCLRRRPLQSTDHRSGGHSNCDTCGSYKLSNAPVIAITFSRWRIISCYIGNGGLSVLLLFFHLLLYIVFGGGLWTLIIGQGRHSNCSFDITFDSYKLSNAPDIAINFSLWRIISWYDPSMPTENGTQNHPCHTTRSSTMRKLKKKHRHERCFQPSRET